MDASIQLFAVSALRTCCSCVFELVRRRRLMERYALLWLLSAPVLLGAGHLEGVLEIVAEAAGISIRSTPCSWSPSPSC